MVIRAKIGVPIVEGDFSMGSGRLSTVSAGAGTSFTSLDDWSAFFMRDRRLSHRKTATETARKRMTPTTAPASAPLETPPPDELDPALRSHTVLPQVAQSLKWS